MREHFDVVIVGGAVVGSAAAYFLAADPGFNGEETVRLYQQAAAEGASVVAFPELGLAAYTCDDLFHQRALLDGCEAALQHLLDASADLPTLREQQRLDEFVACRYPRLRRLRGRGRTVHRDAYREAVAAGRELTLRPPMASDGKPVRLLP